MKGSERWSRWTPVAWEPMKEIRNQNRNIILSWIHGHFAIVNCLGAVNMDSWICVKILEVARDRAEYYSVSVGSTFGCSDRWLKWWRCVLMSSLLRMMWPCSVLPVWHSLCVSISYTYVLCISKCTSVPKLHTNAYTLLYRTHTYLCFKNIDE